MQNLAPNGPIRRLFLSICALSAMPACIDTTEIQIQGGALELNNRLRADMEASAGMTAGRFFADGSCAIGAANSAECHFVTPVRTSLIGAGSNFYFGRLRRSDFLWVAGGNGYHVLSWEFVGGGLTVIEADDPSNQIATNVTIGTCGGFPLLDPETRQVIPEFQGAAIADARAYVQQFDVGIRACTGPTMPLGVSETLEPVTGNCGNTSIAGLLGQNYPAFPQNAPFCVVDLGFSSTMSDVSFSATPGAVPGVSLNALWPGLNVSPRTLLPNLKTVPLAGLRTISRPLVPTGEQLFNNEDGTTTHWLTFRVGLDGNKWRENFSPNIFVTHARVRNGPWVAGGDNYLPIQRLKVNTFTCQVRVPGSNDTEYDILRCETEDPFKVTPAYLHDSIDLGPVDDVDRITWEVLIRLQPAMAGIVDQLFLELDLTAEAVGQRSANLIADPPARDLGSIRTGLSSPPQNGFTVENFGVTSTWVDSVQLVGGDAAEFGTPILHRGAAGAASTGSPITAPLILQGGSTFSVVFTPAFQSIGQKQSQLVVTYRNADNTTSDIRTQLYAQAVTPAINLHPAHLVLIATPGAGLYGSASAVRAALLTNDGPVTFDRTGVSFGGPDASSFRVQAAEFGAAPSSLAQPQTIGPGEAEIYRIGFYPERVGDSNATLIVSTSEGDVSIQLHGHCQQNCEQPPELMREPPSRLPEVTTPKVVYPKIEIKTDIFGRRKKSTEDKDD